jgi:hypothetical protein
MVCLAAFAANPSDDSSALNKVRAKNKKHVRRVLFETLRVIVMALL